MSKSINDLIHIPAKVEAIATETTEKNKSDVAKKPRRKRSKKSTKDAEVRDFLNTLFNPTPASLEKSPTWGMSDDEIERGVKALTPLAEKYDGATSKIAEKLPEIAALAWLVPVVVSRWTFVQQAAERVPFLSKLTGKTSKFWWFIKNRFKRKGNES